MNKKKIMLFSVAALMTISPVVPLAASSLPAQAATNQSKIGTLALPKRAMIINSEFILEMVNLLHLRS